jgi:hypothetical protein
MPEALADVVCRVFTDVFDRHRIVDESAAARILARVPKELAVLNLQFAELNLQLDVAVAATANTLKRKCANPACQHDSEVAQWPKGFEVGSLLLAEMFVEGKNEGRPNLGRPSGPHENWAFLARFDVENPSG